MIFNKIFVSVVLTTYNREELAKRAIQSILNQIYKPIEIIIVEDASESNLFNWIENIHDIPIEYIKNNKNLGLAACRNIGMRKAQGDFIAYLDDDDVWLPSRLEEQVKLILSLKDFEMEKGGCVQVGIMVLNNRGNVISIGLPVNLGNLKESIILNGVHTFSSSFLFWKNSLIEVGGFDEKIGSGIDDDIWMSLALHGYYNFGIQKPLVIVYKDNRESMMLNTEKRIQGLTNYVTKWSPIYRAWYGVKRGKEEVDRYFISVISTLAAEKLITGVWADFFKASKYILNRSGGRISMIIYSIFLIFRLSVAMFFPFLGKIKRFF
jgi:glycosyltransferase involved in cell wall biosynthesis